MNEKHGHLVGFSHKDWGKIFCMLCGIELDENLKGDQPCNFTGKLDSFDSLNKAELHFISENITAKMEELMESKHKNSAEEVDEQTLQVSNWGASLQLICEDEVNQAAVVEIIKHVGQTGIGINRKAGFGRFAITDIDKE